MYVRLAFAVAAYLEPEILIVDEVLAVGDAEFQSKCLGKMKDVSNKEGRTVLFVSHNMGAIRNLCTHTLLMKNGHVVADGPPADVIDKYLSGGSDIDRMVTWDDADRPTADELQLCSIKVFDEKGRLDNLLSTTDNLSVEVEYEIKSETKDLRVAMSLFTPDGVEIFSTSDFNFQPSGRIRIPGKYRSICYIPGKLLNAGNYVGRIDFDIPKMKPILMGTGFSFTISELMYNQLGITIASRPAGIVHPYLEWKIDTL